MSIYPNYFSVYERLRSGKMTGLTVSINSHVHDGIFGPIISFTNLSGYILASQISNGLITGAMIQASSISSSHIVDSTIVIDDISTSSLHFEAGTGYAYYKP
jgi:hypothetical protein